jgi:hypothetical protein
MRWLATLSEAAGRFDGGRRSFPVARDADIARMYSYEPPNDDYERFFFCEMQNSSLSSQAGWNPHCAGWLGVQGRDSTVCKPVFVAHSTLAAIWLLRETLDTNAIPHESWCHLVQAAEALADDDDASQTPPSAQTPYRSPAKSGKRAVSPDQTTSPKRMCPGLDRTPPLSPLYPENDHTDGNRAESSQPEGDHPGGESAEAPLQGLITAVTNKNRRAEQQRHKKVEKLRMEKRIGLGLRPPADKAAIKERAAYDCIAKSDEATIAWIIKQPISDDVDFYSASPTPYFTACALLEKARVLGNQTSRYHAAQFLQNWREQGTPFPTDGSSNSLAHYSQVERNAVGWPAQSQAPATDSAFRFAWSMCTRFESRLAALHISSRWALALLGEAYIQKVKQLQEGDLTGSNDRSRNRYGKGPVRTEAIEALIKLIHPTPTRKDQEFFRTRLKQAMRWYTIVQSLGWGILPLIPHEDISNRWVERVLRVSELDTFVNLVKRERPDLCAASKALEGWLGPDGIAGGSISGKVTLSIEAEWPATTGQVEEVEDSEEEDDIDEAVGVLQSPTATQESTASPAPLRQMSLLELFHPVDGSLR